MFGLGQNRRLKKTADQHLRHARFCRNMREDIVSPILLGRLDTAEVAVRQSKEQGDWPKLEKDLARLDRVMQEVMPQHKHPAWREWVEILLVAVSIAMACREYFAEPFKIPTGSMEPTLYGIHCRSQEKPGVTDRLPLKLVKWFVSGEWYMKITAKASGMLSDPYMTVDRLNKVYEIGGVRHVFPADAEVAFDPGTQVRQGDVLWAGIKISGDHVFVNKAAWNFRRPRRSEVIVFLTNGIEGLRENWNKHYIKRAVGLPGEAISVRPPNVIVNGAAVSANMIGRISAKEPPYKGYQLVPWNMSGYLRTGQDIVQLDHDEYFACGDNTESSFDSRFWGPVRRSNMVGPAGLLYWPFSKRWGKITR